MSMQIVVVHDDPDFRTELARILRDNGFEVAEFPDSLAALAALEQSRRTELLITRIRFRLGIPHGISLALMAHSRRHVSRILFVALPEYRGLADGIGEFLEWPVAASTVAKAAKRIISQESVSPPHHG